jgi:glucosamine-6-phosphate deaminase
MKLIKVKDYAEMSEAACALMVDKLAELKRPIFGLATGSTPEGLYERLIEQNKQNKTTFKHATTFNLDEYVGLDKNDPNSYNHFMNEKLFKHIDIPIEQTHLPNGIAEDLKKECNDYEGQIRDAGYIDVQILGIGTNGHIGFNEPGTSFSSRTQVIELDESTRHANARFFNTLDEVPTKAITMGIESIMESKEIVLLASGENKAEAIAHLMEDELTEAFPASILNNHAHVTIIADEAALSKVKA